MVGNSAPLNHRRTPVNIRTHSSALSNSSLSEETIPAVRGEWYNYRSTFTPARPLGYLMKCKANKDRPLPFIEQNDDVDIVFVFGTGGVQMCSPKSSLSKALMEDLMVDHEVLSATTISQVHLTPHQFAAIRASKDRTGLVSACRVSSASDELIITEGAIFAVTTPAGKYCLMRTVEVGPDVVRFDACHILL